MQKSLNSDLADKPYAARIASAVLASFMQQPPDMKTMLRQLTVLFEGKPRWILAKMVDPEYGLAAQEEFFSIAACNKWLSDQVPEQRVVPEHRLFLPEPEPENVSPEERSHKVKMLKGVADQIRQVAKTNCVGRPDDSPEKARQRQREAGQRTQAPNTREQRAKLLETDLLAGDLKPNKTEAA